MQVGRFKLAVLIFQFHITGIVFTIICISNLILIDNHFQITASAQIKAAVFKAAVHLGK